MLSQINRLRKKKDFEKLFKEGKSFKSTFLVLKAVKNNLKENRFGFIVSKKVSKKAILRNKIKRNLRDIVRQNIKDIKSGVDVVLIVLPDFGKKNFSEIKEILNNLLKKAGLI
ncbi:MAG: ribonuclease P protein component [Candidatus Staskawiczbacteria bacterium]|nr:ribonuclease P protein component [Candidatus Staskawiczbacteria bacterium]